MKIKMHGNKLDGEDCKQVVINGVDVIAELATLRAENDRLRDALKAVVITRGRKVKYDEGYETYDPISIAKEALK